MHVAPDEIRPRSDSYACSRRTRTIQAAPPERRPLDGWDFGAARSRRDACRPGPPSKRGAPLLSRPAVTALHARRLGFSLNWNIDDINQPGSLQTRCAASHHPQDIEVCRRVGIPLRERTAESGRSSHGQRGLRLVLRFDATGRPLLFDGRGWPAIFAPFLARSTCWFQAALRP